MGSIRNVFSVVGVSLLTATFSGCGISDQPQLGLVTGSVMLDNEPVPGVSVTFQPDNGRPAIGTTDQSGDFQLTYKPKTPGCKVGHCRVIIGYEEGGAEGIEMEGDDVVQSPGKSTKKKIPAEYNVESKLEAEVKPGENVFTFDLKSEVAAAAAQ